MKLKENNRVSLTLIAIIILAILLVVAVVGCVYLLNNPIKETILVQNPLQVSELNSSSEVKQTTITADEKFKAYANGMKKIIQNLKHDGVQFVEVYNENVDLSEYVGTYTLSSEYGIKIDYQQNVYINDKKVTNDVINLSKVFHIQPGDYIFCIKSDGSLEYIVDNDYASGKYISHKLDGFKNIVDVISIELSEGNRLLAIDIEGNSYEINL